MLGALPLDLEALKTRDAQMKIEIADLQKLGIGAVSLFVDTIECFRNTSLWRTCRSILNLRMNQI